jgi:pre-mRNA-processing factor 17
MWEFGIPVVAKKFCEPDMHAIPTATLHPNGWYFAGQIMDNSVVIYDVEHRNFKLNLKKNFTSQMSSGYACGFKFSQNS